MNDHDHHHGPVDDDGYCELHGFKKIGEVWSSVGCFAIIDIGAGIALTDWFRHLTGNDIADPPEILESIASGEVPDSDSITWSPALEEWAQKHAAARQLLDEFLMSRSHEVFFDGWKGMSEAGVVINSEQGGSPVYARFCDPYGTGEMSICEIRIDLHPHYHHDLDEHEEVE